MNFTLPELIALREVCDKLAPYVEYGAAPLYVLSVCARESDLTRLARNPSGAFGYFQRISKPAYKVTDGAQQIRDYGNFTLDQIKRFGVEDIPTVGHFYCLNLAPARVKLGILYASKGPYNKPLHWGDEKWAASTKSIDEHPEVVAPKAYLANQLFDVPWRNAEGRKVYKGFIALEDLSPSVEAAAKRNWARIEHELRALEAIP